MKIYFAGAIRAGRQKVYDYQKMVKKFEECGGDVLTKHVADPELSIEGENISFKEIYERDIKWLKECDIVFADVTIPSLGIGYELAYAESLGKPIYAIYEQNANVSGFLRGDEKITFLTYNNIDEVIDKIGKIMKDGRVVN